MARVISDAGPLIALAKADSLFVPRDLFSRIRIPEAVWLECVQKTGADGRRIEQAASEGWLNVVSVATKRSHPPSLGIGEVEAIQLRTREGAADRGRSAGKARGNATWTGLHRNRSHAAPGRAEIDRRQRRGHDSTHGRMRLSDLAADLAAAEGADFTRWALFGQTGGSAAKTSASSQRAEPLKSDHEVVISYDSIMSCAIPEVTRGPERLRLHPLCGQGR